MHADDLRRKRFVIILFDTETSCGGKEAEIIQLAQTEQGQTISGHSCFRRKLRTQLCQFHQTAWRTSVKLTCH